MNKISLCKEMAAFIVHWDTFAGTGFHYGNKMAAFIVRETVARTRFDYVKKWQHFNVH